MLDSVREARRGLNRHTRETRSRIRNERIAEENEKLTRRAGGTRETVSKLRPDPIMTLIKNNIIDDGGARDLHRIARAYELTVMPVRLRLASFERIDGTRREGALKAADVDALRWFDSWWPELKRTGQQKAWTAIIDLCIDGMSLRAIEEVRGWRHGSARELVLAGLRCYAEVKRQNRKRC